MNDKGQFQVDPPYFGSGSYSERLVIQLLSGETRITSANRKTKSGDGIETHYFKPGSSEETEAFALLALWLRSKEELPQALRERLADLFDPLTDGFTEPRKLCFKNRNRGRPEDGRTDFNIALRIVSYLNTGKTVESSIACVAVDIGYSEERVRDAYYKARKYKKDLIEALLTSSG